MIEIQVNSLVKSFEVGKNVLDGLTFQVDQGERVGLLGKNGAGKTTLFKILTGELDYDEGAGRDRPGPAGGPDLPDSGLPAGLHRGGRAALRLRPAARAWRRRWQALAARMAAGRATRAILRRYGDLTRAV